MDDELPRLQRFAPPCPPLLLGWLRRVSAN
jgi:hypothetical protein